MRVDIERWQSKYRRATLAESLNPDPLLSRHSDLFSGEGIAFDIASGTGHAAVYLALRGYEVMAFDCSVEGLRLAQLLAVREGTKISPVAIDLDEVHLPRARADVLTCFRYLNRALFPAMLAALKPGGLLIYKTFNQHHLRRTPSFNQRYVLRPGELGELTTNLSVIDLDDGNDSGKTSSWLIARTLAR